MERTKKTRNFHTLLKIGATINLKFLKQKKHVKKKY